MKTSSPFKSYDRSLIDIKSQQSLKLNDDIYSYCKDLYTFTGSEFFTLMIGQGQESMILSNIPYTSKLMYYKRRLRSIDIAIDIDATCQEAVSFPSSEFYTVQDKVTPEFITIMEKELGIHNHFALTKACDNYGIKLVLSGTKGRRDFKHHCTKNKAIVESFSLKFIERYKAAITDTIPSMRFSRIFKVDGFLDSLIKQKRPIFYEVPKDQELLCLFFFKEDNGAKEIANITGYSVATVNTYLRSVREKMNVDKTYQAAIKAIQDGLIC
ncbi:helix-turn-helix transcriptional regulator [Vibrio hepatarius]|uniref:helix-turn-helix transcriptional regulator n=1 Tax=Vibrio hepatarius TaxID=171383 RepID=UPI001C0816CA|nr:LuxR C-terminal-related transcriptional regulator [Vibrio hepatarius]MBU2896144.1 LuxR C-terminal-related transcriptional regulator [Vibrio hepatarius]